MSDVKVRFPSIAELNRVEGIYCLRDLKFGQREPSNSLIAEMNESLDEGAKERKLNGSFIERKGTQYKIATDVLQYYIIRRYEK